jgi:hypothetical protein
MSFIIDDSDMPCTAAGIGGVFIPEELTILEVCQDSDNLDIIYIIATIKGVYAYTPTLEISWGDNVVIVDDQYIPKYKGEGVNSFPIDNKCSTHTVTLAYNIGPVVPNFKTLPSLHLKLTFNGSSDLVSESDVINSTFQSSNPYTKYTFEKGLSPTPYKVYFDSVTNKLKTQFVNLGSKPCLCAIDCVVPTTENLDFTVCKNEIQEVTVKKQSIVGDPTNAKITFVDSVGNQTDINLHLMNDVRPLRPQALDQVDPCFVNVTFGYVTENGKPIDSNKVQYQMLRYEKTSDNAKIWKDWSSKKTSSFIDTDVKPGKHYGYAVRFRGEFGEVSSLSKWSIVYVR